MDELGSKNGLSRKKTFILIKEVREDEWAKYDIWGTAKTETNSAKRSQLFQFFIKKGKSAIISKKMAKNVCPCEKGRRPAKIPNRQKLFSAP